VEITCGSLSSPIRDYHCTGHVMRVENERRKKNKTFALMNIFTSEVPCNTEFEFVLIFFAFK
jgi:hypothetical protein